MMADHDPTSALIALIALLLGAVLLFSFALRDNEPRRGGTGAPIGCHCHVLF